MAYSGFFTPENKEKWYISNNGLGRGRIKYRSLWELKFMRWADSNENILLVASEEVVIPYRSPVDGKIHRYYLDAYIKYNDKEGNVKEKIIEIKPRVQTKPPRKKKNLRKYLNECKTYAVNTAKWQAARIWAEKNNMEFVIMDEYSLGIR